MFFVPNMQKILMLNNPSAYSLLELTIVMSLLSLFFLTAMPVIPYLLDQQKTKGFVQVLASDLYLASNEARARQVEAVIDLYPSYSTYLVKVGTKQVKKVQAPKGNTISSNYTSNRITFYGDGQVSKAGTITVKDSRGRVHKLVIQLSSGRFWVKNE